MSKLYFFVAFFIALIAVCFLTIDVSKFHHSTKGAELAPRIISTSEDDIEVRLGGTAEPSPSRELPSRAHRESRGSLVDADLRALIEQGDVTSPVLIVLAARMVVITGQVIEVIQNSPDIPDRLREDLVAEEYHSLSLYLQAMVEAVQEANVPDDDGSIAEALEAIKGMSARAEAGELPVVAIDDGGDDDDEDDEGIEISDEDDGGCDSEDDEESDG